MSNDRLYSSKTLNRFFYAFLLLHFLIWVAVPLCFYGNPPNDSLEGVTWGYMWLFGTNKHPFLAAWLSAAAVDIFGSVGLAIYVLSQLSVITFFIAVWKLGKKIFNPAYALLAVMLLEGINYYTIQSAIFDPNLLMLPLWAFTVYFFYMALMENKYLHWVCAGLFFGLGMLAKYETAILFFVLLALLLSYSKGRQQFKQAGIYLAALVSALVFLPNFIWLTIHHFDAIRYASGEMQENPDKLGTIAALFWHPTIFFLQQLGNFAPVLILFLPFYKQRKNSLQLSKDQRRFLWFMAAGPLLFTLLFSIMNNAHLVSRWGFPFFCCVTLLWLMLLKPHITRARLNRFFIILTVYTALSVVGIGVYFKALPYWTHRAPHSDSIPGKLIAQNVTNQWHRLYHTKLSCVIGDHHLLNNVSAFSKDRPIPYYDFDPRQSPWINLNDLKKHGGVILLWLGRYANQTNIAYAKKCFPDVTHIQTQNYHRLTGANVPEITVWMGFVPPAKA